MSNKKRAQLNDLYPTLFIDSERVLAYRQLCQKTRETEEIWPWFVLRRVSIYFSLFFIKVNVSPNQVTWASLLFFFLTGILIVMAQPWSIILAVISYNIGYLCDCIDGEMARIKKKTSRRGVFIDTLIRGLSIPITFALGWLLFLEFSMTSLPIWLSLGLYGIVVVGTMALFIPLSYELTVTDITDVDPVATMRNQSKRHEWLAFCTGLPGLFALLPIGLGIQMWSNQPIVSLLVSAFLIMFILRTMIRLKITLSALHD